MVKENKGKEGYSRFLNRNVKIVFYDNINHVNIKEGVLISNSSDSIIVFSYTLQTEILIPKDKIIRVELKELKEAEDGKK